jgi:hypothetical protein
MDFIQSKVLYKNLLIRVGVNVQKAEEASQAITFDDMRLISDIWPDWQAVFPYSVSLDQQREMDAPTICKSIA